MFWQAERGGGVSGAGTARKRGVLGADPTRKRGGGGLRCGSGQNRGVFTAAHTYTEHMCEYPPPPPPGMLSSCNCV